MSRKQNNQDLLASLLLLEQLLQRISFASRDLDSDTTTAFREIKEIRERLTRG